jgi:hypothetical protein
MSTLLPFFNAFQRAVDLLKQRCTDDSGRLEFLFRNDGEVRKAAGWLYFEVQRFETLRSQRRYMQAPPPWFTACMTEYRDRWANEVDRLYGALALDVLSEGPEAQGLSIEEVYNPAPSSLKEKVRVYGEFVPGSGDGDDAINGIMQHLYDANGLDDLDNSPDGTDWSWMLKGVEAWDFFHDEVQLDFKAIEERWKKLPRAYVPAHLSTMSIGRPYSAIAELLNDAINAYLIGAHAAAVVTCRAIIEHMLKAAYLPKDGVLVGQSLRLDEMIDLALHAPENKWMWKLDLHRIRQFANAVVHRPVSARWDNDASTKVLGCLTAAAALIERAQHRA